MIQPIDTGLLGNKVKYEVLHLYTMIKSSGRVIPPPPLTPMVYRLGEYVGLNIILRISQCVVD